MSKFPKKNISTEKRAKSIDDAIELALEELNIAREDAEIEIIQEPKKGFLGVGGRDAIVKVTSNAVPKSVPKAAKTAENKTESKPKRVKKGSGIYDSDSPAENAKNFISDILTAMGLDVKVEAEFANDVVSVNLEGDNMGVVIGKRGDTLDSLQYLTSLVVNQKSEDYIKVSIDTENYREKREEAVIALATRLAAKVANTGRKFALEPMNPYERRIIHACLQDNEDVTTFSVGQEPYRKVVIAPTNPKPYAKRNNKNRKNDRHSSESNRGGYNNQSYDNGEDKSAAETPTYKADFKPQQHKAEFKNFEEYLAAHSKD